jgi:hypothetical protein
MDPFNPMLDRGNADFDVRQRPSISGVWAIPVFKGKTTTGKILGGWEFAPSSMRIPAHPYCTRAQSLTVLPASRGFGLNQRARRLRLSRFFGSAHPPNPSPVGAKAPRGRSHDFNIYFRGP